jgi:hypothetical protein
MPVNRRDDVLFVGMNKFAPQEAQALRARGTKVDLVSDSKAGDDKITVGKGKSATTFDLSTDQGRKDFVKTLGLPAPQAAKIADVLKDTGLDARDELAQLAQVWAKGEKGEAVPGRIVLSGHSGGSSIYGSEDGFTNGSLNRDQLTELAKAMPKAAAQVEDIALSACYCGGESTVTKWKEGFPNAKTMLAYSDKSPSGAGTSGSRAHLRAWDKATRGDVDSLPPGTFKGLEKAKNVATWSVKNGYLTPGALEKREVVQKRVEDFKPNFDQIFEGTKASGEAALRPFYNDLQNLKSRPETTAAQHTALDKQIETTFRLMKYDKVKVNFQKDHGAEVKKAATALGLSSPNFGTLSRKDALAKIAEFEKAAQGPTVSAETKEAVRKLTEGLRDLTDTTVIPRNTL